VDAFSEQRAQLRGLTFCFPSHASLLHNPTNAPIEAHPGTRALKITRIEAPLIVKGAGAAGDLACEANDSRMTEFSSKLRFIE